MLSFSGGDEQGGKYDAVWREDNEGTYQNPDFFSERVGGTSAATLFQVSYVKCYIWERDRHV